MDVKVRSQSKRGARQGVDSTENGMVPLLIHYCINAEDIKATEDLATFVCKESMGLAMACPLCRG